VSQDGGIRTVGISDVARVPEDVINHHRAFIAHRRAQRPSEEYRDLTPAEWDKFLGYPIADSRPRRLHPRLRHPMHL
jgi:hypothetical protein